MREHPRSRPSRLRRGGTAGVALLLSAAMFAGSAAGQATSPKPTDYVASVHVVQDTDAPPPEVVQGVVFNDVDRNGRFDGPHAGRGERGQPANVPQQGKEKGIPGVALSNGREVVVTDRDGRYELPARDSMTVFATKPAGFHPPVDEDNVPQFFYHHKPEGSPDLRFGGLAPTGPLPQAINFPMAEADRSTELDCAIIGDTQTYSNRELGYLRDGVIADLAAREDLDECGALIVGDVAGDDLGLYPRIKDVMSLAGVPVRAVPGNHDLDFDAADDEDSFDTFLREIGPAYYSYDVGDVHVVGLDNVRYPCTPVDNADGAQASAPTRSTTRRTTA